MAKRQRHSGAESNKSEDAQNNGLAGLENQLQWRFAKPSLLQLALTHRSYAYESKHGPANDPYGNARNAPGEDNEQLEFLGDAVLGVVVTETLFAEFPDCSEGELTRMRAALVSRERMAELGETLGLGELLLLGKSAERGGARRRLALLANAAEAVLAALYLDAGEQGLPAVRGVVHRLLTGPDMPRLRAALSQETGRGALRDSKTLLQERVQAERTGRVLYVDIAQSGPAHQRTFTVEARLETEDGVRVLAEGEGTSKKEAQQRAAALALERWAGPSLPQGRGAA